VGTSYPVIKDEDILNLPIPLIDKEIQQQIAELIEKSFALRRESERLLEEAKEMVEKEIES
jgi:type I restriction enzyme S subunit